MTTSCLSRVGHNLSEDSAILLNKHEISIGRSPSADVIILSIMISKKHALLKDRKDGKWTITDQYSTNGIFVNEEKISPGLPQVLYFGDIIHLGKCSDYFLYFFKRDRNVEQHIIEHSFNALDQNNCKLKKICPKTENKIFLLSKGENIPLASKRKFEMSIEIVEAEKQIKKMKKQLTEKECAEQKLLQEMAEKERQISAALKNERDIPKEGKNKLQDCLEAELKIEEALFGHLKNEKDKYLETRMIIEKELQQEMEKKLEKKIKEIEAKLLSEKGKLEKIIVTQELEHICLEKQLETVQADNLAQKDLAFQICEGIIKDMSQIVEVEFQCIICSELFIQATTLNCSHTFCGTCISDWCKNKTQCPICRCTIKNLTISLVIDNCIDKIVEVLSDDMKVNRKKLIEERKKNTCGNPISDYNYIQDEYYFSDTSVEGNDGSYERYGPCTTCGSPNHWAIRCPFYYLGDTYPHILRR